MDAEAFLQDAQQGATVNESLGWVQNLNQPRIESQLNAQQQQLQSHIETQNLLAAVGEALGRKRSYLYL